MGSTGHFEQIRACLIADRKLIAVGMGFAAVVLAFDLLTPLGVAGGVPYVVLVLLCLWAKHAASTYMMAVLGTVLVVAGYFFSPEGGIEWVVLTNRALAILAIWAVALFSVKRLTEIRGRQSAETKRQAYEKRLTDVLGLSSDGIISVDREGNIEFFNAGAENIFGYDFEEVLGRPLDMLLPEAVRDIHHKHMKNFAQGSVARRPMGLRSELSGIRKDGSVFPAMASISKIETNGDTLYTAMLHDISDRKEAQEQLQHAQKLESVGRLTGGIAHEFNNLLMVIFGSIEMIESRLGEHDPLEEFTSRAMAGARRGAKLTKSLLAFSRKQNLETGKVDLNGLILGMQELFQHTLGETITIGTDLEADLWPILTDAGQIEATLLNFVVNARDAMPKGGTITLRTSNRTVNGDFPHAHDGLPSSDYVVLEVTDTGVGMTPEVRRHAFEPFYTTKEVGKGTGLGLSAVYGFAKQSGGHVEADSEVGKGTTMRLYLPRSLEQQGDAYRETQELGKPRIGGGTILVVEDDAEVRAMADIQLAALGYDVIDAGDGLTALAILDERPDVDLLFVDMVLPGGLSGPETVREAREKYPDLKALFVSGYPDKDIADLIVNGDDIAILQKPYTKSALADSVAAAMSSE